MHLQLRASTRRRREGGQGNGFPAKAAPAAAPSLECHFGQTRVSPPATRHEPDPRAHILGHQPETAVLGTRGRESGGRAGGTTFLPKAALRRLSQRALRTAGKRMRPSRRSRPAAGHSTALGEGRSG